MKIMATEKKNVINKNNGSGDFDHDFHVLFIIFLSK